MHWNKKYLGTTKYIEIKTKNYSHRADFCNLKQTSWVIVWFHVKAVDKLYSSLKSHNSI